MSLVEEKRAVHTQSEQNKIINKFIVFGMWYALKQVLADIFCKGPDRKYF